jgi:outer membrane protein OmpA-like peptidoglycan-associated protein
MKILITGLVVFIAWSIPSSYWYVCNIKNLCPDEVVVEDVVVPPQIEEEAPAPTALPEPEEAVEEVEIIGPGTLNLYSEFNEATFMPSPELGLYLQKLAEYLEAHPDKTISITGNADAVGSREFNRTRGMQRAENVKKYLLEYGLEEARISVYSNGKDNPLASNDTEEGRAKNRRTEIKITN